MSTNVVTLLGNYSCGIDSTGQLNCDVIACNRLTASSSVKSNTGTFSGDVSAVNGEFSGTIAVLGEVFCNALVSNTVITGQSISAVTGASVAPLELMALHHQRRRHFLQRLRRSLPF